MTDAIPAEVTPSTNFVFQLSETQSMRIERIAVGLTNVIQIDADGKTHRLSPTDIGKELKGAPNQLTIWNTFSPERRSLHERRTIVANGRTYWLGTSGTSKIGNQKFFLARTENFPRRVKEFVYRGIVDGQPFAFRLPNPIYPFTNQVEFVIAPPPKSDFQFHLKFLRNSGKSSFSDSRLAIAAVRDGRDYSHWFDFKHLLHDDAGNISTRMPSGVNRCKLEIEAYRNDRYQWQPDEYVSVKPGVPRPGNVDVHPINRRINGIQVHYVLVGGPGHFVVSNGVVRVEKPIGQRKEHTHTKRNAKGDLVIRQTTHMPHWAIMVTEGDHVSRAGPYPMIVHEVRPSGVQSSDFVAGASGKGPQTHEFRLAPHDPGYELRLMPQLPLKIEMLIDPQKIRYSRLDGRHPQGENAVSISKDHQIYVERIALGTNRLFQIDQTGRTVEMPITQLDRRFLGEPGELQVWSIVTGRGHWRDVRVHFDDESYPVQTWPAVPVNDGIRYTCFRTAQFPRRKGEIRFSGRFGDKPFELRVTNPFLRPGKPASLTVKPPRHGPYEFKLGKVSIRPEYYGTEAIGGVIVHSNGVNVTRQFTQQSVFSDASGNRGPAISTNEAPWKMETSIYQTAISKWPADSFIPIRLRRQPKAGEVDYYKVNEMLNGVRVVGVIVGGPGNFVLANETIIKAESEISTKRLRPYVSFMASKGWKIERSSAEAAWVTILTEGEPRGVRLTTFGRTRDGSHFTVKVKRGGWNPNRPQRNYHGAFDPAAAGPNSVLCIAPQMPMLSEFLINPGKHLLPPQLLSPEAARDLRERMKARRR